jgi:hypothetical protein
MDELKRYDLYGTYNTFHEIAGTREEEHPTGEWMKADDVIALLAQRDARITELEAERHYLRWFHANADFGPAETDVIMAMQAEYAKDRPVPATWIYE